MDHFVKLERTLASFEFANKAIACQAKTSQVRLSEPLRFAALADQLAHIFGAANLPERFYLDLSHRHPATKIPSGNIATICRKNQSFSSRSGIFLF
jgi:hypothetical protein